MKNPTLIALAEAQKAKLDPNMQDAFERIYLAGMDFMYGNDQTSAMSLKHIHDAESIPVGVGEGVAMIIMLLLSKSRGKMPMEAGVMAGYALVCEGLDFVEQKGMLKVDNAAIDTANAAYGQKLMNQMKISDAMVNQLKNHAQQVQDNPQIKEAYRAKYGQNPGMPADQTDEGGVPQDQAAAPPGMDMMGGGGMVGPAPDQAQGAQP